MSQRSLVDVQPPGEPWTASRAVNQHGHTAVGHINNTQCISELVWHLEVTGVEPLGTFYTRVVLVHTRRLMQPWASKAERRETRPPQ